MRIKRRTSCCSNPRQRGTPAISTRGRPAQGTLNVAPLLDDLGGGGLPYAGTLYSTGWAPAPEPEPVPMAPFFDPFFNPPSWSPAPGPLVPPNIPTHHHQPKTQPKSVTPSCQDEKNALYNCLNQAANWRQAELQKLGLAESANYLWGLSGHAIFWAALEGAAHRWIFGKPAGWQGMLTAGILGAALGVADAGRTINKGLSAVNDQYMQKVTDCKYSHPLGACR